MQLKTTSVGVLSKKIASFLGILQGLTWVILSLIFIIIDIRKKNEVDLFIYYNDNEPADIFDGQKLTSEVFIGFVSVYLVLDLIWLLSSVYIITRRKHLRKALELWSYITLVISLWDIITVFIIGLDYHRCIDVANMMVDDEITCVYQVLPYLIMATRGIILWIANVVSAIILIRTIQIFKKKTRKHERIIEKTPIFQKVSN